MPTNRVKRQTGRIATSASSDFNVQPSLSIVYRAIDTLNVDALNPRLHSRRQIEQIANSIKTFGFNVPFLIDSDLRLIAGHGRLAACKLLNLRRVPTICLDHLTEAQIRAFSIADNRLTENASWDDRLLAAQLKELSEADLDFDLEITGFEMGEIDVMLEGLAPGSIDNRDAIDSLPEIESAVHVTQAGNLWQLDRHRIFCGDALDEKSFSVLLDGKRAAAVLTDPPFNDPIDGYVTGFGKVHHPEFPMASGEMSEREFTDFLRRVFGCLIRSSEHGALHYIFIDWRHIKELLAAAERQYAEFKNLCVWAKESGGQGSLYRSQHELIFVFRAGEGTHRNNVQLGQYGRYRTNIWHYPRVRAGSSDAAEARLAALHPTVKPTAMVADAILDCTARNEIVLDAFLGSGTTLMAAERTGRIGYGIELEPFYVDLAVRRWQNLTGHTAINAESGKSFAEIEEAARV